MQQGAHIGPSVVIKGEISAKEPITVSGRVDGTIDAPGQVVTIEAGAHVSADVAAAGIVVSGMVTGSLVAEDRITLRAGAEVTGDLTAPRLSVDDGACVRGKAVIEGLRAIDLARAS
jgi:cytoskeletal protein CcmA (bactofilin family)